MTREKREDERGGEEVVVEDARRVDIVATIVIDQTKVRGHTKFRCLKLLLVQVVERRRKRVLLSDKIQRLR